MYNVKILSFLSNDFIDLCAWQMSKIVHSPPIHFASLTESGLANKTVGKR